MKVAATTFTITVFYLVEPFVGFWLIVAVANSKAEGTDLIKAYCQKKDRLTRLECAEKTKKDLKSFR